MTRVGLTAWTRAVELYLTTQWGWDEARAQGWLDTHPDYLQAKWGSFAPAITTARYIATEELTPEDGIVLFEKAVRRLMDMSGAEFLVRWDRGDYYAHDHPQHQAVTSLAMLIPFARPTQASRGSATPPLADPLGDDSSASR